MDILKIIDSPLAPWQEMQDFEITMLKNETGSASVGGIGANACFVGTMRDFNEGDDVATMTLEHYPEMTDKQLRVIVKKSYSKWPLLHTLLIHRVGTILPGEPIVLVSAWSAHRGAAFDACRYMMEELKHSAPFWKKEQLLNGDERWVAQNTKG